MRSIHVILRHDGQPGYQRGLHWDLMLEWSKALRTWALAQEPVPDLPVMAEPLPDHRLMYLDYEGPISGNRGTVSRWDSGEFDLDVESPLLLIVALVGDRLRGRVVIQRSEDVNHEWQFTYRPWVL